MAVPLSNKNIAEKIQQMWDNPLLRQQAINDINLKGLKQYVIDNFSMSAIQQ